MEHSVASFKKNPHFLPQTPQKKSWVSNISDIKPSVSLYDLLDLVNETFSLHREVLPPATIVYQTLACFHRLNDLINCSFFYSFLPVSIDLLSYYFLSRISSFSLSNGMETNFFAITINPFFSKYLEIFVWGTKKSFFESYLWDLLCKTELFFCTIIINHNMDFLKLANATTFEMLSLFMGKIPFIRGTHLVPTLSYASLHVKKLWMICSKKLHYWN